MALIVISTTLILLGILGKASGCGDIYTTESGTITHPAVSGNYYNNNELCAWIIKSPIPLYFYFSRFSMETSFDNVYARDGSRIGSPLINKFSGKFVNSTFITTGDAYIQFRSDSNVVGQGFVLHWKPYSAEEQCKAVRGFCVSSENYKCYGNISIIHNYCDDRCVCCVPPQLSEPLIMDYICVSPNFTITAGTQYGCPCSYYKGTPTDVAMPGAQCCQPSVGPNPKFTHLHVCGRDDGQACRDATDALEFARQAWSDPAAILLRMVFSCQGIKYDHVLSAYYIKRPGVQAWNCIVEAGAVTSCTDAGICWVGHLDDGTIIGDSLNCSTD